MIHWLAVVDGILVGCAVAAILWKVYEYWEQSE